MKQNGFIALVSILIISALMLLIGTGITLRALGSSRIEVTEEDVARAEASATACAEYALMKLKDSDTYTGNETLKLTGDPCTILPIGGSGASNRTVQVTSTIDGATRKMLILISTVSPTMSVTWQEVPSF